MKEAPTVEEKVAEEETFTTDQELEQLINPDLAQEEEHRGKESEDKEENDEEQPFDTNIYLQSPLHFYISRHPQRKHL